MITLIVSILAFSEITQTELTTEHRIRAFETTQECESQKPAVEATLSILNEEQILGYSIICK